MTHRFGRNSRLLKRQGSRSQSNESSGTRFGSTPTPPPAAVSGQNYLHWPAIANQRASGHRFGFTADDDCLPPRTLQERHQSRGAAEQFIASHKRQPSKAETDALANKVYKSVYPGGPYPIPSASHPCAKRWLNIRGLIVKRLKAAAAKPGVGGKPRRIRKRGKGHKRTTRPRSRRGAARRFSGTDSGST